MSSKIFSTTGGLAWFHDDPSDITPLAANPLHSGPMFQRKRDPHLRRNFIPYGQKP